MEQYWTLLGAIAFAALAVAALLVLRPPAPASAAVSAGALGVVGALGGQILAATPGAVALALYAAVTGGGVPLLHGQGRGRGTAHPGGSKRRLSKWERRVLARRSARRRRRADERAAVVRCAGAECAGFAYTGRHCPPCRARRRREVLPFYALLALLVLSVFLAFAAGVQSVADCSAVLGAPAIIPLPWLFGSGAVVASIFTPGNRTGRKVAFLLPRVVEIRSRLRVLGSTLYRKEPGGRESDFGRVQKLNCAGGRVWVPSPSWASPCCIVVDCGTTEAAPHSATAHLLEKIAWIRALGEQRSYLEANHPELYDQSVPGDWGGGFK